MPQTGSRWVDLDEGKFKFMAEGLFQKAGQGGPKLLHQMLWR